VSVSPYDFAGRLIITWPKANPNGAPPVYAEITLADADTGVAILTAVDLTLTVSHEQQVVAAEMTMLCDEDGKMLLAEANGRSIVASVDETGAVRTGRFRWLVAEMRVAE
jgi:hypothetical protein